MKYFNFNLLSLLNKLFLLINNYIVSFQSCKPKGIIYFGLKNSNDMKYFEN